MKFATTVLALSTLYSTNAFVAQVSKPVMQPLQSDRYGSTTVRGTANSPYRSGRTNNRNGPSQNSQRYDSNGNQNEVYGRQTENYSRETTNGSYSQDEGYGRQSQTGSYNRRNGNNNRQNNNRQNQGNGRQNQNESYSRQMDNVDVRNTANSPFSPPKYDTQMNRRNMNSFVSTQELFDEIVPVEVQGGSLRTCSFEESVDRVSVLLKTTGRPLNASVELWQGPDNSPQKMAVYLEDGELRPFHCTVEAPGGSNAIAIRNTGQMEFPLTAGLKCDQSGYAGPSENLLANSKFRTIQGGAVYTTPFSAAVRSVQIALRTDGRPLNARIELLQGPNNNKQVMEVYTEDGQRRPFYVVVDTPGSGNVVRIVNTSTVEFPLTASAEPYIVGENVMERPSPDGGMTWS